jgi:hypothetical protein
VPTPEDAELETFADQLLVTLRTGWLGFAAGALLAAPLSSVMACADSADGALEGRLEGLFTHTYLTFSTPTLQERSRDCSRRSSRRRRPRRCRQSMA